MCVSRKLIPADISASAGRRCEKTGSDLRHTGAFPAVRRSDASQAQAVIIIIIMIVIVIIVTISVVVVPAPITSVIIAAR